MCWNWEKKKTSLPRCPSLPISHAGIIDVLEAHSPRKQEMIFFFHNGMIYNFPELGKTKPVNSKTRFVTLKLQNIWSDFSSNIGYLLSKLEVMGREGVGNRQRRGLSLWVWLSGSAFRGLTLFPRCTQSTPCLFLAFSPPPPTPHSLPRTLSSYSAGRSGQTLSWLGGKRKGWWKPLQGLSLKPWWWKDSTNLNNFSQENSILCLLKSKAFSNP